MWFVVDVLAWMCACLTVFVSLLLVVVVVGSTFYYDFGDLKFYLVHR